MVARLPFCHQRGVQDGSRSLGRSAARRERGGERRSRVPSLAYYSKKKKMTLRPVGRTSSASGGPNTRRDERRGGGGGERGRKIGEECLSLSASLSPCLSSRSLSRFPPEISVNVKVKEGASLRRSGEGGRRGVSARLQYSPARAGPTDSPSVAVAALAALLGPRGGTIH